MMMKKVLVVMLVLGLVSAANAALTLKPGGASVDVGKSMAVLVNSSAGGAYQGWLEIVNPAIADFDNAPAILAAGNTGGNSSMTAYPEFGAWYNFTIASLDPAKPILAGDHVQINIKGIAQGKTVLNLYADDAATLLDTKDITVVPEPVTLVLLGLGGLFLRRR